MVVSMMIVMVVVSAVVVPVMMMKGFFICLPGVFKRWRFIVRVSMVVMGTVSMTVSIASLGQRGQREEEDEQEQCQGNRSFVGLFRDLCLLHCVSLISL